jgi:hypothetical protein
MNLKRSIAHLTCLQFFGSDSYLDDSSPLALVFGQQQLLRLTF